jgi:hypothetical protein
MSAYQDDTTPPIEGAAIVARALGVDESTLRMALSQVGAIQRPVGLSLFASITMQDARRTLGFSIPPAVTLARYLTAR